MPHTAKRARGHTTHELWLTSLSVQTHARVRRLAQDARRARDMCSAVHAASRWARRLREREEQGPDAAPASVRCCRCACPSALRSALIRSVLIRSAPLHSVPLRAAPPPPPLVLRAQPRASELLDLLPCVLYGSELLLAACTAAPPARSHACASHAVAYSCGGGAGMQVHVWLHLWLPLHMQVEVRVQVQVQGLAALAVSLKVQVQV